MTLAKWQLSLAKRSVDSAAGRTATGVGARRACFSPSVLPLRCAPSSGAATSKGWRGVVTVDAASIMIAIGRDAAGARPVWRHLSSEGLNCSSGHHAEASRGQPWLASFAAPMTQATHVAPVLRLVARSSSDGLLRSAPQCRVAGRNPVLSHEIWPSLHSAPLAAGSRGPAKTMILRGISFLLTRSPRFGD